MQKMFSIEWHSPLLSRRKNISQFIANMEATIENSKIVFPESFVGFVEVQYTFTPAYYNDDFNYQARINCSVYIEDTDRVSPQTICKKLDSLWDDIV